MPPIISRLPQLQAQVARKYSPSSPQAPFLATLPPLTYNTLNALDLARINQGQNPYTAAETQIAGTAAAENRDVIQADQPWYRDFVSDIADVATSIPRLPLALYHEATELPNLPVEAAHAIDRSGGNPIETVGNLAKVPGLRLLPGSFTASQFASGGPGFGGLTEHPGFTLLDLLPVAEAGAGLTSTVRTAKALAAENAANLGTLPTRVPKLTTLLTKSHPGTPIAESVIERPGLGQVLDEAGKPILNERGYAVRPTVKAIAPNPIGRALSSAGQRLGNETGIGRVTKQMFARTSQTASQALARATGDMAHWVADPSRAPDAMARAGAQLLKDSVEAQPKFAAIPVERMVEIGQGLYQSKLSDLTLTPVEAEFAATIKAGVNKLGQDAVAAGRLQGVEFAHGTELFPPATAQRFKDLRAYKARADAGNLLRNDLLHPEDADIATTHYMLSHMLADNDLTLLQKQDLTRAYLANLEQLGTDVTPARRFIRDSGSNKATYTGTGITDRITLPDSSPVIRTGKTTTLTREAQAALGNLDRTPLSRRSKRTFSAAEATRVTNDLAEFEAGTNPARWDDLVMSDANKRIASRLRENFSGPSLDAHLAYAAQHSFDQVPATSGLPGETFAKEAQVIIDDARRTWQDLAAQGLDPVFHHRVTPGQAARELSFPRPLAHPITPSQYKARVWDAATSVRNPMVALQHQAVEHVIEAGTRQFLDTVMAKLSIPGDELIRELAPMYTDMAARSPSASPASFIPDAIKRAGYTAFDPESFIKGVTPKSSVAIAKQSFVPTGVAKNLELMRPQPETLAGQVLGAPMRVFRTSVLALSPRWHANNILGGMVMMMAQARNPVAIWRYTADAWRMAKEGGVGQLDIAGIPRETTALATPTGRAGIEGRTFHESDLARAAGKAAERASTSPTAKVSYLHNFGAGQTLWRLWQGSKKAVDASYQFNQLIDDFYRSMAFLEGSRAVPGSLGKEFAAMRGMTREEQVKAGILKSNNVLQQWDKLTPLERSSMRMVMPFYSWVKTVLKYAVTLPVDHPWRVNVLANIARAEQEDLGTGIPQHLRRLLFLGDPDTKGNVTAINLAGANPFTDVANYASLVGFFAGGQGNLGAVTSNLNPALSTALQYLGVDTMRGQAELYPDLQYDPVTGQPMAAQPVNPLLAAVNNLVPPTRAITSLAGWSSEFKALAARDPSAAARTLTTSLGLPAWKRTVNVPQEIAKDQVRQYQGMIDTRNQALREGNLGLMSQYPGLSAFKVRAEKLQASQDAAKYTPQQGVAGGMGEGVQELLQRAAVQG